MFYFLGMSDKEIANCLSIDRTTSFRNRINSVTYSHHLCDDIALKWGLL
ncbi:MAG: hypothetical protein RR602_09205, partial [Longicatena sp.]